MATTELRNTHSVTLGTYATVHGRRELVAVRVDGEITVIDLAAEDLGGGERDQRVVEEGLVEIGELRALAVDYLARAAQFGRPLARAA